MKTTEAGLRATHDAIMNLQLALQGIFDEKAKYHHGYPIMAEGIVCEILRLRKEIDDMIGLTDYIAEFGVPPTNEELDAMSEMQASSIERASISAEAVPAH